MERIFDGGGDVEGDNGETGGESIVREKETYLQI